MVQSPRLCNNNRGRLSQRGSDIDNRGDQSVGGHECVSAIK